MLCWEPFQVRGEENMWRVLLVEDQTIVRQGLRMILEQDPNITVTHEAENGTAGN